MKQNFAVDKYKQYSHSILISPLDVQNKLHDNPNTRIIEIRKKDSYQKGHIQGSVQIERTQLESSHGIVAGMIGDRLQIQNLLSKLGCNQNTHIILFDERGCYDACRFWWLLKIYGHTSVSIIDGGIDGWNTLGLPLVTDDESPKEDTYIFENDIDDSELAYLHDILRKDYDVLVDVRSKDEYTGKVQQVGAFSAGRIPNSVFLPYDSLLEENSHSFKDRASIEKILQKVGINKDDACVLYCQSGVRSAHTLFVLKGLLDFEKVKNYDGSWIEYSATNLPMDKD